MDTSGEAAAPVGNKDAEFKVDYAKSNKSKCRGCEEAITKGKVRVSKKDYESNDARRFGPLDRWYHVECFAKFRGELKFFDDGINIPGANTLSIEDNELLKKTLPKVKEEDVPPVMKKDKDEQMETDEDGESTASVASNGGKALKRSMNTTESSENAEFKVDYAKSNKSKCRGCEEIITKGEIRVSKKDYESNDARRFGPLDRWYHLECFAKRRDELQFFADGATIPGASTLLSKEDNDKIKKVLPKIKDDDVPPTAKKVKTESEDMKEKEKPKKHTKTNSGDEAITSAASNGKSATPSTEDTDYKVEYAKSSKSKCRGCEETITKHEIRVCKKDRESNDARRFGPQDRWYHLKCFAKLRSKLQFFDDGTNIPGANTLSIEDNNKLKKALPKINEKDASPAAEKDKNESEDVEDEKFKKQRETSPASSNSDETDNQAEITSTNSKYADYKIEYAKSSRSKCRGCDETILKGKVRVCKIDRESNDARRFGPQDRWHHLECFAKLRNKLKFFDEGTNIPGANTLLSKEDHDTLKKVLPQVQEEDM